MTAAESSPEGLRTRAEELLDARRLDEAVEVLSALIAVDPDSHWAYRVRGVVRSELGDVEGAMADLDRSVQLAPEDAAGWARRAELRAASSDLASATVDVERALELDPQSLVAWTARATIRRQRGDLAGAEADLTHALGVQPDSAWLLTARAGVRDDAGDLAGARADINRAVELDPSFAHGWALHAHIAGRAGENDLAVDGASRAIALEPDNGWAYGNRGLARQELLTRGSMLQMRAEKAVERADVAYAATLELTLSAIDDVMRRGGDDAALRDVRARTESARAALSASASFTEEVKVMKARLTGMPPAGPSTAPTVS